MSKQLERDIQALREFLRVDCEVEGSGNVIDMAIDHIKNLRDQIKHLSADNDSLRLPPPLNDQLESMCEEISRKFSMDRTEKITARVTVSQKTLKGDKKRASYVLEKEGKWTPAKLKKEKNQI